MHSTFNFAADRIVRNKAYPALTKWTADPYTQSWREFVQHWPYTIPCELHEHCASHNFDFQINPIEQSTAGAFYCVGLGFFDFSIDYFDLIPKNIFEKRLKVLFYYHEGDNPYKIKQRLDQLCDAHNLSTDCYKFISGNSAADNIKNFAWFPDHELLYWQRNQEVPANPINLHSRPYRFTVLNRTHKWWRATVMTDLHRSGVLDHSLWSYNTNLGPSDVIDDNPIEIDTLNLRQDLDNFVKQGPYFCDNLTAEQHNNHHLHVPEHYSQSYCNIVVETHFDVDNSKGTFLTEKTFKPIKHGQPFVIVGPPGTLAQLRLLGYRTFDHVIDNGYDLETNNTKRWIKLSNTIRHILAQDPDTWFKKCLDDVQHNQDLFCRSKQARLNMLHQKIYSND